MLVLLSATGCAGLSNYDAKVCKKLNEKYSRDFKTNGKTKPFGFRLEGIAYPVDEPDIKFPFIYDQDDDNLDMEKYLAFRMANKMEERVLPVIEPYFVNYDAYCVVPFGEVITDESYTYEQFKLDSLGTNELLRIKIIVAREEGDLFGSL